MTVVRRSPRTSDSAQSTRNDAGRLVTKNTHTSPLRSVRARRPTSPTPLKILPTDARPTSDTSLLKRRSTSALSRPSWASASRNVRVITVDPCTGGGTWLITTTRGSGIRAVPFPVANHHSHETNVADQVALPQATRLGEEPEHPLESGLLDPAGCLGGRSRDEVERGTDSHRGHTHDRGEPGRDLVLLGGTHPHP